MAQTIAGWEGDMQKNKQNNAAQMNICVKLMQPYATREHDETGTQIQYAIERFRTNPEKLKNTTITTKRQNNYENEPHGPSALWKELGTELRTAIIATYPEKKTHQNRKDTSWI